jgi:hypothetical protein
MIFYISRWESRIGRFELYEDYLGTTFSKLVPLKNTLIDWLPKYTIGQSAGSYRRIIWRYWNLLIYRKTILSNKLMKEKLKKKEVRSIKPTA